MKKEQKSQQAPRSSSALGSCYGQGPCKAREGRHFYFLSFLTKSSKKERLGQRRPHSCCSEPMHSRKCPNGCRHTATREPCLLLPGGHPGSTTGLVLGRLTPWKVGRRLPAGFDAPSGCLCESQLRRCATCGNREACPVTALGAFPICSGCCLLVIGWVHTTYICAFSFSLLLPCQQGGRKCLCLFQCLLPSSN